MNYTEKVYINLISGCINDEDTIDVDFSNVGLSQLIALCKMHNNVSVIYHGLKKAKTAPKEFLDIFEKGFYTEMLVYSKRTTILNMIIEALNKNDIRHIIFKGQSIARLYPGEELRTMSDIDFLIEEENMDKAQKIMEGFNAVFNFEGSDEYSKIYKVETVNVELHSRIAFNETLAGKYNFEKYFGNPFEHTELVEKQTYMFKPEYNLIYVLYHIAKHFFYNGCGVRMITDLAVIINAYGDNLNWNWIWEQLDKIGLRKYSEKIFSLCNYWFSTKVPNIDYNFDNIDVIADYIISGGVFGFKNVDVDTGNIRRKNGNNYFVSILKWAFPSYKSMKEHSMWFKDKPSILLPVAYVERFVRNATIRGSVVKWLKSVYSGKAKSDKHDNLLKIMELK